MTEEITNKKDWETAEKQYTALYVNNLVNLEAYKYMIEFCRKKIKEFPEEAKDPMPDELKEIARDLK